MQDSISEKPKGGIAVVPRFKSFKTQITAHKGPQIKAADASVQAVPHPKMASSRVERYNISQPSNSHLRQAIQAEQSGLSNDLFVEDRRGDDQNLVFEKLDRRQIPAYHRYGEGKLIGTTQGYSEGSKSMSTRAPRIDSTQSLSRSSLTMTHHQCRETEEAASLEVLVRAEQVDDHSVLQDFLPFEDPSYRTALIDDSEQLSTDLRTKASQGFDPTPLHQSELSTRIPSEAAQRALLRQRELRRKAEDDPDSVQAWIEIISDEKQAVLDGSPGCTNELLEQTIASVAVSIIQDALSKAHDSSAKEQLLVIFMEQASLVWDKRTLKAQWERVIDEYPRFGTLWLPYLDFQQTENASFDYENIRLCFLRCFELSNLVESGVKSSHYTQKAIFSLQLQLAVRLSRFELEAGYTELALGQWQAILEYTTYQKHQHGTAATESGIREPDLLFQFERFWESEAPRIGEEVAEGWATWQHRLNRHRRPAYNETPRSIQAAAPTSAKAWASLERELTSAFCLPARSDDENDDDDPYRIVLFDDIRPFLLQLPLGACSFAVIDAFLMFCRLPLLPQTGASSRCYYRSFDPFLQNVVMPDKSSPTLREFDSLTTNFIPDQHTMFSKADEWFLTFPTQRRLSAFSHWQPPPDFIMHVLEALVELYPEADDLKQYSNAFRLHAAPDTVRSKLKNSIKKSPFDLQQYNVVILIDLALGKTAEAETTLIKTLSNIGGFPENKRPQQILLWRTCLWELVKAEAYTNALSHFSTLPLGDAAPDVLHMSDCIAPFTQPLKPKRLSDTHELSEASVGNILTKFASTRDHHLKLRRPELAIVAAECLFLLTYCYDHQSLNAVGKAFTDSLKALQKFEDFFSEALHQAFARLLYHHSNRTTVRLVELREFFEASVKAYPKNTIFITLHAQNERRLRIDDRLKSRVNEHLEQLQMLHPRCIIPSALKISCDMARRRTGMATAESVRHDFERALVSHACRSWAGLWAAYFSFELAEENYANAENILSRALDACPWTVKAFTLEAIDKLYHTEDTLNLAKTRALCNLIEEKGCRLRTRLPDC